MLLFQALSHSFKVTDLEVHSDMHMEVGKNNQLDLFFLEANLLFFHCEITSVLYDKKS